MKPVTYTIILSTLFALSSYNIACSDGLSFKEKISFNIGAGYGNYDMKRKMLRHSFYEGLRVHTVDASKRIEGGIELYGEIEFDLSKNIAISSGCLFSHGSRDLSEIPAFLGNDYQGDIPSIMYEVNFAAPYLKLMYRSKLRVVGYSFSFHLYYGQATLYGDIVDYFNPPGIDFEHVKFDADGSGYAFSLDLSYRLLKGFHLVNSIGYRVLNTGNLHAPDGDEVKKSKLDFSGMFLQGAISVSPWER